MVLVMNQNMIEYRFLAQAGMVKEWLIYCINLKILN